MNQIVVPMVCVQEKKMHQFVFVMEDLKERTAQSSFVQGHLNAVKMVGIKICFEKCYK